MKKPAERVREKEKIAEMDTGNTRGGKKYTKDRLKHRGMEDVSKSQAFHNQFLVEKKKEKKEEQHPKMQAGCG